MKRYLLYFSYIGSGFRGIQRQIPRHIKVFNPVPAVAEVIEDAFMKRLRLLKLPILNTASRTDAGVHALRTSGHIDLDLQQWKLESVLISLNFYFSKISCPIRILSIQRVKDDFDARSCAVRRSYLYRIAIKKPNSLLDHSNINLRHYIPVPITEYLRCHFIHNSIDIDKGKEVVKLLEGEHDFCTFMGSIGGLRRKKFELNEKINTVKKLEKFELLPGKPFLPSDIDDLYDYWDLRCTSKSFLFRQVRRMVSVILAVAGGKIPLDDVKYMLDNPSSESWKSEVSTVPAHGLYLTNVEYNEEDLIEPVDEQEQEKTIEPQDLKISPKDVIGLSINEKINLRLQKIQLEKQIKNKD